MIFWTGAESSAPLSDLIRFHVIWTAIGLLGHRITMAPYVVSTTGRVTMPVDAQYVYETYGSVSTFPIMAPYDPDTWYSISLVSHAHRELYHFENTKHGVKDVEQAFGEEVIHINSQMLSKEGGFWLVQTAWTIIHEYSHLLSGTKDAVGTCTDIYFRAYDRNGKDYYFKDGEVKEKVIGVDAKRLRFHDGALQVGITPKYIAYRKSKMVSNLPADSLTCLLFACSSAFNGVYEGTTKLF